MPCIELKWGCSGLSAVEASAKNRTPKGELKLAQDAAHLGLLIRTVLRDRGGQRNLE